MTTLSTSLRRLSPRQTGRKAFAYSVLVLVTILVAMPAIWLLITSLKKEVEYLAYPIVILPKVVQWRNYFEALFTFPFLKYSGHSLLLSSTNATLSTITSSLAGFAFSRFVGVPGRNRLFSVVTARLIIPQFVMMIPSFIVFSRLRLTNTYWPWVLWGLGGTAFQIFMFRQFFASIPKELEEAAEVDGAGPLRIFLQIILPNSKPVLATSFILAFTGVWGDYLTPVVFLNDAKTTLAVKLATAYINPQGISLVTVTMAAAVLYTLPLIIMFFVAQKHILKGMVTSGIKG